MVADEASEHGFWSLPVRREHHVFRLQPAMPTASVCRLIAVPSGSVARGAQNSSPEDGERQPKSMLSNCRRKRLSLPPDCQMAGCISASLAPQRGSPSFSLPRLIRPTVRRLLRAPRLMGLGPLEIAVRIQAAVACRSAI